MSIKDIEQDFSISLAEAEKLIRDFHSEMKNGLDSKAGSLKMLPAYVDMPTGEEKGRFLALDIGGTNLRILKLELKGKGKIIKLKERKFVLKTEYTIGSSKKMFDFIACRIKDFLQDDYANRNWQAGFTFSFPVKQTGINRGELLHWTKGFSMPDAVGKDVVGMLDEALKRCGVYNVTITALVNDTVGTLFARSYKDANCDVGMIIGTGTNACYREKFSAMPRWKNQKTGTGKMIINIEWGDFNKIRQTVYDKILDKDSQNPGRQILEKMVSGMYLGEITRLAINDLIENKVIFNGLRPPVFRKPNIFKTEYMSQIENDRSAGLKKTEKILLNLSVLKSGLEDRCIIKEICGLVSRRASYISAIALGAVVTKIDPGLRMNHTIAVDGSVYEKYTGFARNIKSALKCLFGRKSSKIGLALTKDGSGIGAVIVASVAHASKNENHTRTQD